MAASTTWKCEVCGYVHEGPEPPETCPVCGVGADMFTAFEVASPAEPPSAGSWQCSLCGYLHQGDAPPDTCPVCGAATALFEPRDAEGEAASAAGGASRLVIVGNGVAGVSAAEEARKRSPDVHIQLISREDEPPYYRINLTRFLAGEVGEDRLALKSSSWFEDRGVARLTGDVIGIDRVARQIHFRDGAAVPYDRLILANGAHPFVPPIPGTGREGVLTLRSVAQARQMLSWAQRGGRAVCIGGGLLGLEAAAALSQQGADVTVVESFDWLLPRQLAEPAARLLRSHLEARGIGVVVGAQTDEIVGDEAVQGVRLKTGEVLPAELVLLSTGVRPNSYLARQSGIEVNKGIIVDDRMQTSDPAIFAAGDVAEHRGVLYGLWPSAYAQGVVAGANAVGATLEGQALPPSNRLKVTGVDLFSIGQFQPADGSFQVFERTEGEHYCRLVCRDGQLVGANLYGDTSQAGPVKSAVEEGTQLAELTELRRAFPELDAVCRTPQ